MWFCQGTRWLVSSAPRHRFALGKSSAAVALVGRLKYLEVLPPPISLPLPSWFRLIARLPLLPSPFFPPPQLGPYCSPPRTIFGRYTKTRIGYASPPGRR